MIIIIPRFSGGVIAIKRYPNTLKIYLVERHLVRISTLQMAAKDIGYGATTPPSAPTNVQVIA